MLMSPSDVNSIVQIHKVFSCLSCVTGATYLMGKKENHVFF